MEITKLVTHPLYDGKDMSYSRIMFMKLMGTGLLYPKALLQI